MIDTINKFFAMLARLDFYYYMLSGAVLTFLLLLFNVHEAHNPLMSKPTGQLIKFIFMFIVIAEWFLPSLFYEKYELGREHLRTSRGKHFGPVFKDTLFYTKITSNIKSSKKLFGYLYVLNRIFSLHIWGSIFGLLFYIPIFILKNI
jgi:hypothetical protein